MVVVFEQEYLRELYTIGKARNKKYRFQPDIVRRYIRVVGILIGSSDVNSLTKHNALHYEKLQGDKVGISSVRVNDQYRIEFIETTENGQTVATICRIIELSNHYK